MHIQANVEQIKHPNESIWMGYILYSVGAIRYKNTYNKNKKESQSSLDHTHAGRDLSVSVYVRACGCAHCVYNSQIL